MVSVRPARESDNPELLNLEKMCPQGTDLVLSFDRSPDFFCRSRIYGTYRIHVAEEEGKPVGTVGLAEKTVSIDGKKKRAAYVYDVRVHPDHRGKGVGSLLVERSLKEASEADIAYAVIVQDNAKSITLFRKLGFDNNGSFSLLSIPVRKKSGRSFPSVRAMASEDAPQVVGILNEYYASHDFYAGCDVDSFSTRIERLRSYGLVDMHVIERDDKISACCGLWDYSAIFRVTALHISRRLAMLRQLLRFMGMFKETAKLPSVGEPFRLMYATDFACIGEPEKARELIDNALNLAHSRNSSFLCFALHPSDPLTQVVAKHKPIEMKYDLYGRWRKDLNPTKLRTLYVDPVDL